MDLINAIFQAISAAFSDVLPVSGSGHLAFYRHLGGKTETFHPVFFAIIHTVIICVLIFMFRKPFFSLCSEFTGLMKDISSRDFSFKTETPRRDMLFKILISTSVLIPFLIPFFKNGEKRTSLIGLLDSMRQGKFLLGVGIAFIVSAVLMIFSLIIYKTIRKPRKKAGFTEALIFGLVQALALLIPGVSRVGALIGAILICGISKKYAFDYVFMLSIPSLLFMNIGEYASLGNASGKISFLIILLGIITAAVVTVAAVRAVYMIVMRNYLVIFGIYSLAAGFLITAFGMIDLFGGKL